MNNPLYISDKMITGQPSVANSPVSRIRPSAVGWHVPFSSPIKPQVTAVLSQAAAIKVQKLTITGAVTI